MIAVINGDGLNRETGEFNIVVIDRVQQEARARNSVVAVIERVIVDLPESVQHPFGNINRYLRLLPTVVDTDIVEPEKVIGVIMCEQNGIDARDAAAKALGPEVGSGIDNDTERAFLNPDTAPQAVIAWIGGQTDIAVTPDFGYAE